MCIRDRGISELVMPVSLAIVAAGADGLMIEVHENPECALCDGRQLSLIHISLTLHLLWKFLMFILTL